MIIMILFFPYMIKGMIFHFNIVNYPFLDSCIPRKPALGVFLSKLIRYARICSRLDDFCLRAKQLVVKLKLQGYKARELKRLTIRFYQERNNMILKYNIHDVNILVSQIDL